MTPELAIAQKSYRATLDAYGGMPLIGEKSSAKTIEHLLRAELDFQFAFKPRTIIQPYLAALLTIADGFCTCDEPSLTITCTCAKCEGRLHVV